ncbi:MAG: RNA polymerase sigma factor [Thermoanaerobaculia bacterium]
MHPAGSEYMPDEGEDQLDKALLQRSIAGDRQAFLGFTRRHQAAVLRFCRTVSASSEDAEDVLQETFLTAWRKADTFEGRGSARSWLFTIARRKVYRAARASQAIAAGEVESLEELGVAAGWGRSGTGERFGLDEQIEVRQAFESLSPADRQILILRDLEGLSGAEAATVLGVELPALKSRLHRARLRLMSRLAKGDGDER